MSWRSSARLVLRAVLLSTQQPPSAIREAGGTAPPSAGPTLLPVHRALSFPPTPIVPFASCLCTLAITYSVIHSLLSVSVFLSNAQTLNPLHPQGPYRGYLSYRKTQLSLPPSPAKIRWTILRPANMHSSLVSLRLVLLVFMVFTAAFAANLEDALQKRQSPAPAGTGSSASPTTSTTSSSPTSPSAKATSSLSQSSSPSASSTPAPSITPTTVTSPSATPSSSSPISTTATPTVVIQTLATSATEQIVTTLMSTDSSGSTVQQVLTTSGLVSVGNSVTTSTSFPGISSSAESSGSSGLSSEQKKIIIGVVVGVGGFVILVGMALVAWRVWGRKKQPLEDDDRVHTATPDARTGPGGSPFKSTLDQYHNPGTVNTASNF